MVFYFFIAPHNTQNHLRFRSSDLRLCACGRRQKTFAQLTLNSASSCKHRGLEHQGHSIRLRNFLKDLPA